MHSRALICAVAIAAVAALGSSSITWASGPRGGCAPTPRAPALDSAGEVVFKGSWRCTRTVRRSIDRDNMAVLASGKVISFNGRGEHGRVRVGAHGLLSGSSRCAPLVVRVTRRYQGDAPTHFFVRLTLSSYNTDKRFQRRDSAKVPVTDLCHAQRR